MDKTPDIDEVHDDIAAKYVLTDSQKAVFSQIKERTKLARKISQDVLKKYNISARRSPEGDKLYCTIYGTTLVDQAELNNYGFALGFRIHENLQYMGDATLKFDGVPTGYVDDPEHEESRLPVKGLTIRIRDYCIDDLLMDSSGLVESHELRHAIDQLLHDGSSQMIEMAAYLFANDLGSYATRLRNERHTINELTDLDKQIERRRKILSKSSGFLLRSSAKLVEKAEHLRRTIEEFPLETLYDLMNAGLDNETLSYIVSLTPPQKLERRLRSIYEHMKHKSDI